MPKKTKASIPDFFTSFSEALSYDEEQKTVHKEMEELANWFTALFSENKLPALEKRMRANDRGRLEISMETLMDRSKDKWRVTSEILDHDDQKKPTRIVAKVTLSKRNKRG